MKNKKEKEPSWKRILIGVSIAFLGALLVHVLIEGKPLPWSFPWGDPTEQEEGNASTEVPPSDFNEPEPTADPVEPPPPCPHHVFVIDKNTQDPVSGAQVLVLGLEERMTSHAGMAQLAVPSEKSNGHQVTIRASKDGKKGQVMSALCDGNDTTIEIQ